MADPHNITPQEIQEIQIRLLDWFEANQRDYPWRRTTDPFLILVAEKLLQQTSARTLVVDAYLELLHRYPTPEALARANFMELREIIHSLGFHYRAHELINLAQVLVDNYNGRVPREKDQLLKLPGVGEYTMRAVVSFAYNEDMAVVDTNVARLFYRIFALPDSVLKNPARREDLQELAALLLPKGRSREFNFAVLDFCALICITSNPKCSICPIQSHCEYGKTALRVIAEQ